MKKEDCFQLGLISKIHSFKGEVILFLDTDVPENYYDLTHFFLEVNKQLVPYFIEKKQKHKQNQLRITIDGVRTQEDAEKLTGKSVFLPLEMLPELEPHQFYFHEIVGFEVVNEKDERVGEIIEVIDNPVNRLLNVKLPNEKEALLPFNDNHILKVNKPKKTIQLSIPEGLLELYQ